MAEMNKVDLAPLRDLFQKQDKMAFWTRVEEALVHWVKVAETGKLPLVPDKKINAVAYAVAVAKATGRPVKKVVFVSRKHPFQKPEWMTENVYRASLVDSLGASLGDSLWDSLWDSLRDSLFYTCGFALAGDEKRFKVCLDHLKVQEQALGLGLKKDEPQTFVALCA